MRSNDSPTPYRQKTFCGILEGFLEGSFSKLINLEKPQTILSLNKPVLQVHKDRHDSKGVQS